MRTRCNKGTITYERGQQSLIGIRFGKNDSTNTTVGKRDNELSALPDAHRDAETNESRAKVPKSLI